MPPSSIAALESLPEKVRAFVALRLEARVEDAIEELIGRLRDSSDGAAERRVRWVRRDNFHLTLFFLGPAVPRERLTPIADALRTIAGGTEAFEVAARGVGAFPSLNRAQVIWVGLESVALTALAARVGEAAARCGFAPETRAYSPHLTIGRVRARGFSGRFGRMLEQAADLRLGVSRIDRVILYRSELGAEASTYRELAVFALGPGGASARTAGRAE